MFVGKGPLAPLLLATAPYLYHYKHYRGKVWATMGYPYSTQRDNVERVAQQSSFVFLDFETLIHISSRRTRAFLEAMTTLHAMDAVSLGPYERYNREWARK